MKEARRKCVKAVAVSKGHLKEGRKEGRVI